MGFEVPLWRAVAVFRVAALSYVAVLIVRHLDEYRHPAGGLAVLAIMIGWTAAAGYAYTDPRLRTWPLLLADLLVACGCLLATIWVETEQRIRAGEPTLPMAWVAGAVLAWAVSGGKARGAVAAAMVSAAGVCVHGFAGLGWIPGQATFNGIVLLFLAGFVVGHGAKLGRAAEARLARAIELEAATRERDRLARGIHDSVLQVLAMVQRRGGEMGGEAAELGRLAGEQEAALRALIGAQDAAATGGEEDLRTLLNARSSTAVTVSTPATPVRLPVSVATEIDAAVGAALDNVRRHCGPAARAWVLLEDGPGEITVSVRDDGPGMPAGRRAQAAAEGRLGLAQSIEGRIRDLGGTVTTTSAPGQGTEIEFTVRV
jgi:signal transduction histidine kinase